MKRKKELVIKQRPCPRGCGGTIRPTALNPAVGKCDMCGEFFGIHYFKKQRGKKAKQKKTA